MFSTERFIEDCRSAPKDSSAADAVKAITQGAVANPVEVMRALGTPGQAGIFPLYQSPELTVLNVIWAPGMSIYPHDHRMWAVIGVYEGREDNVFFKRVPGGVVRAGARQLDTGDAAVLGAQTIHAVTNSLARYTCALQIYGGDFFRARRSEFDPDTLEERPFDVEKAKRMFLDANKAGP